VKSINYKKLLKNAISLLLTFVIMSSILDFIRKPTVPDNINATALYDLQGNPFFLPATGARQADSPLFLGDLVRLLPLYFAGNK